MVFDDLASWSLAGYVTNTTGATTLTDSSTPTVKSFTAHGNH